MNKLVSIRSDIRIRPRGLHTKHINNYTGHIIASYYFQSLVGLPNIYHILLQISYFKRSTRYHKSHNYLSFGRLLSETTSRRAVVSRKVKKKQQAHAYSGHCNHYSELFTWMVSLNF